MKRILFLVNHDVVIYNFRLELVERLLTDGHEVYISSPYGERIDDLVKLGCKYYKVEMSRHGINPVNEIQLILYYRRLLKQIKPDIVFTYTIKPNIYGGIACRFHKIPYIANITGLGIAVESTGILQNLTILLNRLALKNASCVFFQNTDNLQFFISNNIVSRNYRIIPGSGVNLARFYLLDYPSDCTIEFAFISRIMVEKGIDQYLVAAEYIKKKYPNTRFHICGFCEDIAYVAKLKQLQEKGIIVYHGMVRDVKKILEKIHCVVHPTFYPEGISNVLLEGSACGRPIITTNRPGCREVVDHGVNGFIINPRDNNDLIAKIEQFLSLANEERKTMGLLGRAKVERDFNRNIVVNAYLEEIKKVFGRDGL